MKPAVLLVPLLLVLAVPAVAQTPGDSLLAHASAARVKGSADAPITIVELSDFQCPFCARFAVETLPLIDSAYVATGQARIVYLNYPVPGHRAAWIAAEAALCAGLQDAFWPMHDRLFQAQAEWSAAELPHEHFARYAAELGIAPGPFRTCVERDLLAPLLSSDLLQAAGSGARGTPTFVINGERVLSGAEPFETFRAVIEELLAEISP